MKIWSQSFENQKRIPIDFVFGKYNATAAGPIELAPNKNPHLAWSEVPPQAKSLALICHDPDVPSVGDDVNREGKTVSATLARVDFFHWTLINIDPKRVEIQAGEFSSGITPHGKQVAEGPNGMRQGLNNYTQWFSGDPSMEGKYFGYDGPCPPWNDELLHHYHFSLFALDIAELDVPGEFTGQQAREAMHTHILDQACLVGVYAINPNV